MQLTDEQYQFLLKVAHGMRTGLVSNPEPVRVWQPLAIQNLYAHNLYGQVRELTDKGRAAMAAYEERQLTKGQTDGQRHHHARRAVREKL